MRRIGIAGVLATFALLPAVVAAHGGTGVSVRGDVRANGPMEIAGEGFAPNDVVRIELRKAGVAPIELGRVPIDSAGGFAQTLLVPVSVKPGIYQLAADGQESATTDVAVVAAAEASLMEPGSAATASVTNQRSGAETAGIAAFTVATALAGLGLLWLGKTHPRSARARHITE